MNAAVIVTLVMLGINPGSESTQPIPDSQQFAYSTAYHQSLNTRQPLVVIVGAQWCPACRKLENEVIPKIKEAGLLSRIAFAVVDYDAETKVAQQLTRGGPIPQVLVFWHSDNGWKSDRLIGYPSQKAVLTFVQTAVSPRAKELTSEQARN